MILIQKKTWINTKRNIIVNASFVMVAGPLQKKGAYAMNRNRNRCECCYEADTVDGKLCKKCISIKEAVNKDRERLKEMVG